MRKVLGIALFLVLLIAPAAMAGSFTIAEGSGKFSFQTIDQNFIDPPPQWIVDYFRLGVNINVGFQFYCSPAGTIEIRGPIDSEGAWISMRFKTGGLVFKETRWNGYFVFNGVGSFCLYRPSEEGEEPTAANLIAGYSDNGYGEWEHGKANIIGKANYNPRTGIGRFTQTYVHGGNFGFLFRGILQGTVNVYDEE